MSELILLLPWNLKKEMLSKHEVFMRRRNYVDLDRFASFSLLDSPPKNMSELMDLALPNLLTASELLLGPVDTGAGDLLGLTNCVLSHGQELSSYIL